MHVHGLIFAPILLLAAVSAGAAADQSSLGSAGIQKQPPATTFPAITKARLKALWDLKDARKAPFDVEVLSTRTENGYRTDEMVFTSRTTPDGPDRVFCALSRPENPQPRVPAYIDLTGGRELAGVEWLARRYRGAVLDIEWRSPDLKHHTKWARPAKSGLFGLTERLEDNFNTMFETAIRRAIDFLETQPGIDQSRIACGGGSMGGWYSLLTAGLDRRVACVFDVYAAGGGVANALDALGPSERRAWADAFDPLTYAARTKASTLLYLGTNDFFFSLGNAMQEYNRLAGEKRMVIIPNWNHNFGPFGQKSPEVDERWIDHCFYGEPAFPTVADPVARGTTYAWRASGPYPIKQAILYWSPGSAVWAARYWLAIPAALRGDEWSAAIPAGYEGLSAKLYVSVTDAKGRVVSSRIVSRNGLDPRTAAGPLWSHGAAWDVDRGAAAWRLPGPARSSAFWAQDVVPAGTCGIKVTPADAAGKVSVQTNSVALASGRAAEYAGIRLVVNGGSSAGELTVAIERDSGDPSSIEYVKRVAYSAGETTILIPWSELKGPDGSPRLPYPFDGLRIDGDRSTGLALTIEAVELYR